MWLDRLIDRLPPLWRNIVFTAVMIYILGGALCFAIAMLR